MMINVLFDSNVIIDAITARKDSNKGAKDLYLKAVSREINGYLVSKQITDIAYVLRKHLDKDRIRSFSLFLCKAFIILPFYKADIENAAMLDGKDFEDGILISIAKTTQIDYLVTNNTADFDVKEIKVLKPDDLLRKL